MPRKNFENRSTNKNFITRINFEYGFYIDWGDNP